MSSVMDMFCTLIFAMMVFKRSFSEIGDTKLNHHDVLCDSQLAEALSKSTIKTRCEAFLEESEHVYGDRPNQERMGVGNLLRTKRDERRDDINLPPGYSMYRIPKLPDNSPMPVFLSLNISKILDWNEFNEYIEVDLELKVMWTDFQILGFNNKTHPGNGIPVIDTLTLDELKATRRTDNNPGILNSIWKPNLFMVGLLSVSQPLLMSKPLTIRFIPELGWFEYITRMQVKLDCSMNYQYYPADTQSCSISVRGFSYTNADLNLTWYKKGVYLSKLDIQNFIARIDEPTHFDIVRSDGVVDEVYDALGFKIVARRKLSYHLIQTYLASSLYCIITTLSLLVPSSMVEARIGMLMTTLLTLTAMFAAIRSSTPIVSYTKAIDIWMVGCISFVFLALFQYSFSIWLKYVKIAGSKCSEKSKEIPKWAYKMDSTISSAQVIPAVSYDSNSLQPATTSEKISTFFESYSCLFFLTIFIIYSVGYWIWLLTASDYFYWNVNPTWNKV